MSKPQALKNMEMILTKIEKAAQFREPQELKTLADIYRKTLDNQLRSSSSPLVGDQEKRLSNVIKDIENKNIPTSLERGEYKETHDYTVALDKLKSSLYRVLREEERCYKEVVKRVRENKGDSKIEKKESFYYLEAMELLEQSIKHNHLITHFNEQHRGIGKTSAIIQKAHDEGYSILCSSNSQVEAVIDRARSMGINDLDVYSQHSNLAGKKYKNFLVDELVDSKNMAKISEQGHKIIGGFYRIVVCF